ncbi:MAG: hypothetical protein ACLVL7_08690 [Anaerotruncus massiliensis (ex Togo et al. 2019)]
MAYHGRGALIGVPIPSTGAEPARLLHDHGVERIDLLAARRRRTCVPTPRCSFGGGARRRRLWAGRDLRVSAELFGARGLPPGAGAEPCGSRRGTAHRQGVHPVPAEVDLLVNAKNELVAAPGVAVKTNGQYFGSVVVTLRFP